jgi:hypothetical protein
MERILFEKKKKKKKKQKKQIKTLVSLNQK